MSALKIMIVEDEVIVAKDIQRILKKLGYEAFDPISDGKRALDAIEELKPDLILLDINLKNSTLDGIQVAKEVQEHYQIPFIFLTAFSDKSTLQRAKLTEPYGYIVKPFEEEDIRTAVEIAYYKFTKDSEIHNRGNRYASALESLEVAIIITDASENVIFMNNAAEKLAGSLRQEVLGKDVSFAIKHCTDEAKNMFKNIVHTALDKTQQADNNYQLIISNGLDEQNVGIHVFPIASADNKASGCAFVLGAPGKKTGVTDAATGKTLFNFLESMYSASSVFIKKDSRFVRVGFKDILWIEALDNYVVLKTSYKEQFILHTSLKDLEAKLPAQNFVRVHRSFIVQTDKISAIEENACIVEGNLIPVGKSYRDSMLARVNLL